MSKDNQSVFGYARISRDDKFANIESIQSQIELLKGFISKTPEWNLAGIISDDNVSGANFDRPGLNELMKKVNEQSVDVVVIKDLSRLGRSNANTLLLLDWFEEHGVRVISTDGRYDSKLDNELAGLETWYNERYIRDISMKTRASLRHKQELGLRLGNPPFGYVRDVENKYHIVPKEPEATTVKSIFKQFNESRSPAEIAQFLNASKVLTPGGLTTWNSTMVRRIIANPVYAGDSVLGKTKRESFKKRKIISIPKEEQLYFTNTHQSLVGKSDFIKANNLIKYRPLQYSAKECLPVFCGVCGGKMYRKQSGNNHGYICCNYSRYGVEKCQRNYIQEIILTEELSKNIMKVIEKHKVSILLEADKFTKSNISSKNSERDKLQGKLERIYQDYLEGVIEKAMFLKSKEIITEKMNSIENDDVNLPTNNNLESEINMLLTLDTIVNLLDKDIIELFVKKIIVKDNAIEIVC